MTIEKQNITSDFYSGNKKNIRVHIIDDLGANKDLVGAELTYILMTDKYVEVLRKSSFDGGITIEAPTTDGNCTVHLLSTDTHKVYGTFRHQMNMIDLAGDEETVMTGTVNIFQGKAYRQRTSTVHAYIQGI
jgi:hypothetical protein